MFDRYHDNVDALVGEIGHDEPQKPRRWVHDGLRRELPAESQEAFEARVNDRPTRICGNYRVQYS